MNEEIKNFLNVCGMPNEDLLEIYLDVNKSFYMQQFAELIIRECVHQIQRGIILNGDTPENIRSRKHIKDIIKKFGINLNERRITKFYD